MYNSRRDFLRKTGLVALGLGSGGCSAFFGPELAFLLAGGGDFQLFDSGIRGGHFPGDTLEYYKGRVYRDGLLLNVNFTSSIRTAHNAGSVTSVSLLDILKVGYPNGRKGYEDEYMDGWQLDLHGEYSDRKKIPDRVRASRALPKGRVLSNGGHIDRKVVYDFDGEGVYHGMTTVSEGLEQETEFYKSLVEELRRINN